MNNAFEIPIPSDVAKVFHSYPSEVIPNLLYLRRLIYETAASFKEVGKIVETLKWGEPSYLTSKSNTGSTIRIAWKNSKKEQYSIYFKCTANLVPAFKEKFPKTFKFGGNRSIDFHINDKIPVIELKQCILLALTYHKNKNLEKSARWEYVRQAI